MTIFRLYSYAVYLCDTLTKYWSLLYWLQQPKGVKSPEGVDCHLSLQTPLQMTYAFQHCPLDADDVNTDDTGTEDARADNIERRLSIPWAPPYEGRREAVSFWSSTSAFDADNNSHSSLSFFDHDVGSYPLHCIERSVSS